MTTPRQLSEREELILYAIVYTFITTAEPVGSRSIVKRFGFDFSAATVRNVMADLEEAGLLEQVHTSSGRVPTDLGYRYYVDFLMRATGLSPEERRRIDAGIGERLSDAEGLMQQTSHVLALFSHQTGIVGAHEQTGVAVKRVEIVPVSAHRIAVLTVDGYGSVRTVIMRLEAACDASEWEGVNRFLAETCTDRPVEQMLAKAQSQAEALAGPDKRVADLAVETLSLLPRPETSEVFLDGATQLFEHPEFLDVKKARDVLTMLEERTTLSSLLRQLVGEGPVGDTRVVIGSESQDPRLGELSVIGSTYRIGSRTAGLVAVLGPRRMPYARLSSVVGYAADSLSRKLTEMAG